MKALYLFMVGLLLASFSQLMAASVELTNIHGVRVYRQHQFGAVFTDDQGQRFDVTNEAHFRATGTSGGYAGRFTFELPSFGSSTSGYETVSVSYTFNGQTYQSSRSVRVDYTPDYIRISGSTYVRSGSSTYLRAQGQFGSRSVDLSRMGRWSALYGSVFNGNYRAPRLRDGERSRYDRVTFSYGLRSDSISITVRQ